MIPVRATLALSGWLADRMTDDDDCCRPLLEQNQSPQDRLDDARFRVELVPPDLRESYAVQKRHVDVTLAVPFV